MVESATKATATFANGVPYATTAESAVPTLEFTRTADSVILIAYSTGVKLANEFTVAAGDSTSGLQVSYGGGLEYTVTKANIFATLSETGNDLTVCGNVCTLVTAKSDNSKAVCSVPSLTTVYSAKQYSIVKAKALTGTWTASAADQAAKVHDGKLTADYTDSSTSCFIQVQFKDEHVGVLDAVKFFIDNLNTSKAPFKGALKLQGYDGSAWKDIWTVDATIHEGWNTHSFDTNKPAYNKFKWVGSAAGACRLAEVEFVGIEALNETGDSKICTPKLKMGSTSTNLNTITYANAVTPTITKISPRYGRVNGGDVVTFTGSGFIDGKTTVKLDGIVCVPKTITTNSVSCTTGKKPKEEGDPSVEVTVENRGLATTGGKLFRYVSYWSETSTWGNDAPPQYGEAVSIPKGRNLLVDSTKVPRLSFVLVEGSLIFAPDASASHHRTFDCGYIFVKGGYMEVGTEENPYTSKITITMHGTVSDPALPTYGNKSIGVRNGELHMVGVTRKVTWTMLDKTANVGDTTVTLMQ